MFYTKEGGQGGCGRMWLPISYFQGFHGTAACSLLKQTRGKMQARVRKKEPGLAADYPFSPVQKTRTAAIHVWLCTDCLHSLRVISCSDCLQCQRTTRQPLLAVQLSFMEPIRAQRCFQLSCCALLAMPAASKACNRRLCGSDSVSIVDAER